MKYKIQGTSQTVDLNNQNFLTKGGEGSIYAKSGVVYKICEPGKMIPDGKFQELTVLDRPNIIKPEKIVLDTNNTPVGYTMKFVQDTIVLCSMFTKAFRTRENVTANQVLELVRKFQETIAFVHQKKILLVDLNELNFLVDKKFEDIYFIDVNSYQTPHYPATAIMDSIRDRHCKGRWSEGTDWFSFAIIAFQMFIGIHPFKGKHPNFTDLKTAMDGRMKANISILNSSVSYPKGACQPLDVIPPVYLKWFEAVFERGERLAPPKDLHAVVDLVATIVKQIGGSNNFNINEVWKVADEIVEYYAMCGREVLVTDKEIFVGPIAYPLPAPKTQIAFIPSSSAVIAGWLEQGNLKLKNVETGNNLNLNAYGDVLFTTGGRFYLRSKIQVSEVVFNDFGGQILPSLSPVANVMEFSTEVYDGVVIQNLFDAHYASIFPQSKVCRQIALRDLDNYKIIDAKYQSQVLMVVAVDRKGRYDRFIFRFNSAFEYDVRVVEDITPVGLNFTVLDNGVCVCLTEDEKIEIFRVKKGDPGVKEVSDPVVEADMVLTHKGSQTMFMRGNKLYSLSLR